MTQTLFFGRLIWRRSTWLGLDELWAENKQLVRTEAVSGNVKILTHEISNNLILFRMNVTFCDAYWCDYFTIWVVKITSQNSRYSTCPAVKPNRVYSEQYESERERVWPKYRKQDVSAEPHTPAGQLPCKGPTISPYETVELRLVQSSINKLIPSNKSPVQSGTIVLLLYDPRGYEPLEIGIVNARINKPSHEEPIDWFVDSADLTEAKCKTRFITKHKDGMNDFNSWTIPNDEHLSSTGHA